MKTRKKWLAAAGVLLLAASIVLNIVFLSRQGDSYLAYLQSAGQIRKTETGILRNNLEFEDGKDAEFVYDFGHEEYPELIAAYGIDRTAGEGSEFERALRLMNEYAPRLTHAGSYDNHVAMNALALLEYSLDKKGNGINCLSKAQILNEMCLALGIYARKVWIMPYSAYDTECHVVNEIWDTTLNKWIMLDITANTYWVDAKRTPLSVLEIRQKCAMNEFCTPLDAGTYFDGKYRDVIDLEQIRDKDPGYFLYVLKNLAWIRYCSTCSVGRASASCALVPKGMEQWGETPVSLESCERSPVR